MLRLADYVRMLLDSQQPSRPQMEDFADFVADAHSWYKHLPQVPPGVPFVFFLNPHAGCDILVAPDGSYGHREREGTSGFHYSWMPTAEYRKRFGLLDYNCPAGTSFYLPDSRTASDYGSTMPMIVADDGRCVELPPEVATAGTVEVTGMIHTRSAWPGLYRRFPHLLRDSWPEVCGGDGLRQRVMRRIEEIVEDPKQWEKMPEAQMFDGVDRRLFLMLEPERLRQRAGLVAAMQRVCDLVYHCLQ